MDFPDLTKKTNEALVGIVELTARSFRSIQRDLESKITKLEEENAKQKTRIVLAEKCMGTVWTVGGFIENPIIHELDEYRREYPMSILLEKK